jgi:hypothetical protein
MRARTSDKMPSDADPPRATPRHQLHPKTFISLLPSVREPPKYGAMVAGRPLLRAVSPSTVDSLRRVGIPVTTLENCASCTDPCEPAEEYSFKVDMTSDLLGSIKPYSRMVVCSELGRSVGKKHDPLAAEFSSRFHKWCLC